ncbi:hypothetical protein AMS68_003914 [Peltaster fructicola]|uniref:Lysine-specific metallo-endopeptidase domain-containing protein n=1 Tax=Peltaster fructicola TaxID=286661 RepID=A0A6H0XUF8_9PEZI|nr:hypothetical protein AMS68_003914 [Peltaster fructicola]
MADAASTLASDNAGFTHYFGGKNTDVQFTHFKQMMAAIASTEEHFSFQFECRDTPTCSSVRSAMVADANVADATTRRTIQVCPRFWTATSSLYLLPREESYAVTPYREHETWCEKTKRGNDADLSGRENQWYATAGHTVLHELTHLDALARQAGLVPDPKTNMHGTEDPQDSNKIKGETCELAGARNFLEKYKETKDPDFSSPDYNAESYAAAATEIYFMKECKFSQVRPQTT